MTARGNPCYRLVSREPDNKIHYPDQEGDIKAAIVWLYKNIGRYGGDANKIYIGGHSAGGILSAKLGIDRTWLRDFGVPESIIRGVMPISGGFGDMTKMPSGDRTEETRRQMSPILHIGNAAPRFVLACGEREISAGHISRGDIEKLRAAVEAKNIQVAVAIQPGADHAGAVLGLSDEYSPETQALLRMITAIYVSGRSRRHLTPRTKKKRKREPS